MTTVLTTTNLTGFNKTSGKARDIYDLGEQSDQLVIVTTDRISAFDHVLPNGIPNKGRVLHGLSRFWFRFLSAIPNHFITDDAVDLWQILAQETPDPHLLGRTMLVRKTKIIPIECIVRGYLSGSGWQEYQQTQQVCGITLPPGLTESAQLPNPIFTPSTKAILGQHDENISFDQTCEIVGFWLGNTVLGKNLAAQLRELSLDVYTQAAAYALSKGIIIADTKLEWGLYKGKLLLADEVLTPDSSRFWPADQYQPGQNQFSFDKQFVRDWLTNEARWNKNSPPPPLPNHIVAQTATKYVEAYRRLTGQALSL